MLEQQIDTELYDMQVVQQGCRNSAGVVAVYAKWSACRAHRGRAQAEEKLKQEKFVLSVAYSPDGRRLACGAMDGTVAVFDVPSGKLLHTLTGHHKPVRGLSFTPGARRPPDPGRVC